MLWKDWRTATVNEENYHIAASISSLNFEQDKSNINNIVNFNSAQHLWETSA